MDTVKIMIVDDEADMELLMRQKFRTMLREKKYDFVFAINGLEALSKLLEHPDISIILSDINMPEMDGLTLLARLNELKNPALKTVIVSAYGDMDNIRTAMNRGAFDFITKPINFEDLEITINKTIEHIHILQQANKEHEQLVSLQHDLDIAKEIQQAILPKVFPPFPNRKDFDLFASMNAAKSVGGDFYDFFLIDDDHLGVVIADVSDKGIPAAIYMAVSRTIIRAAAIKGLAPEDCLEYSNLLLCKESVNSMFVTVFYGILNTRTGEFRYSNAGHNPPYIVSPNGTVRGIELTHDIVMGVIDGIKFKPKSVSVNKGDALYLYTDGVTEAMSTRNELYGEERLEGVLKTIGNVSPEEIIQRVMQDLSTYTTGAVQSDDITMLAVRYHP
ncbi:MAG: SpoIIE family protein phosphatase [Bacteroidetes bacterium]|nr:SpoIIE family protein phosphatase [Bacteroidota bacterium]